MTIDELITKALRQMLDQAEPGARRPPGGLTLFYEPPNPGDLPPLHVLSISHRDRPPTDREVHSIHRLLSRLRPQARVAIYTTSLGNQRLRRIAWREDQDDVTPSPQPGVANHA